MLAVATTLANTVREALGDTTSDSAQRFATETLSATSLEAVHEYARGMEALASSQFEDALGNFSKAVEIDPKFGSAYGALAATSRNLGRERDAERYAKAAISHLDGMTERERYRARGYYYFLVNDYQACVKEYGDLVARYSADAAARNNRALCLTYLRDLPRAVDEMREVVKILPNRALYRENLAQYLVYSGDFATAEQEVRSMPQASLFGQLALGFAQLGRGQMPLAVETFSGLKQFGDEGASYAASGLGDMAIYEGRYTDATRILGEGAEADQAAEEPDKAAAKLLALANAQLQLQQRNAAVASAEKALVNSKAAKTRFLAGRVFVEAGAAQKAQALAAGLASEIQAEPQAYAKHLQALAAMRENAARRAITLLTEANALLRHLDRALRSRARLPGGRRLSAGRL